MSAADAQQSRTVDPYAASGDRGYPDEYVGGDGWVLFAGVMLLMVGCLNLIDGIAAVSNSKFFTANATYIISNLNTLGWVLIVLGTIQVLSSFGIWAKTPGVRWIGVTVAGLNAIAQLVFIPAYPFWSLALFTMDILIIYGLIAHGSRARA
jgi:hypothetical protein